MILLFSYCGIASSFTKDPAYFQYPFFEERTRQHEYSLKGKEMEILYKFSDWTEWKNVGRTLSLSLLGDCLMDPPSSVTLLNLA
jgi:hypothetical protein